LYVLEREPAGEIGRPEGKNLGVFEVPDHPYKGK